MYSEECIADDIELPSMSGLPNPLGAIGCEFARIRKNKSKQQRTYKTDNVSGLPSRSNLVTMTCLGCNKSSPTTRCLQCRNLFCNDCCYNFISVCQMRKHALHPIDPSFIGMIPSPKNSDKDDMYCELHEDALKFHCKECSVFICHKCTLWDHKDHDYIPVNGVFDKLTRLDMMDVIKDVINSTNTIKIEIDRVTAMSKAYAKESAEAENKIRTAMQYLAKAVEDHEKYLLDKVANMRQTRMKELSRHINKLNGMLEGLSLSNDSLMRNIDAQGVELFIVKENSRALVDHISSTFENMNVNEEKIGFIPPNHYLIEQLKRECDVQPISPSSNVLLNYSLNHPRQSCRCSICKQLNSLPLSNHNVVTVSGMNSQPRFYSITSIRSANSHYDYPNYSPSSVINNVSHLSREGSGIGPSGNMTERYSPIFLENQ
ncbi:unnamed protein product [Diatraea saccharalis]|uniref:B box-type domain-containing protein n=1 Tax=Diatraea saccharalis TaxID=40085 RepID=A0A9P1B7K6_9NEOP|nr:unnamed protein product [Diatraea saccharalis]